MTDMKAADLKLIEDLFGGGYVMDFTNRTYADFFRDEVGVNIYDEAYADNGNSKGKRLRTFLQKGQKAAIIKALHGLWEYRETGRISRGEEETVHGARDRLSKLIERLGGRSLSPDAATVAPPPVSKGPTDAILGALEAEFTAMYGMEERAQARGFAFERFLRSWFDAWKLDARRSFRTTGEQIDGSFQHDGATYLVEAKWQNAPADAAMLHAFQGKLLERPDWTRGLYVSYAGFSHQSFDAFTARRLIMMDGMDIFLALHRRIDLGQVIAAKVRHASERRQPFAKVADLFP